MCPSFPLFCRISNAKVLLSYNSHGESKYLDLRKHSRHLEPADPGVVCIDDTLPVSMIVVYLGSGELNDLVTFGNSTPGNQSCMDKLRFISKEIENRFECFPIRIPLIFIIFEGSLIDLQFNGDLLECTGTHCLAPHPPIPGGVFSGIEIRTLEAKRSCHRFIRLLKNAHLRRFPHPSSLQRTSQYASLLRVSGALHLDIFEQPPKNDLFSKLLEM